MSSRGGRANTRRATGPTAPFVPHLPVAGELERLGDSEGGLYRGVDEETPRPSQYEVAQRYVTELSGNKQVQAALTAIADHWDAATFGYDIKDPASFGDKKTTQAFRSMIGIFHAYDAITTGRAAIPLAVALQQAARTEFGLRRTANTATPQERATAARLYGAVQPGLRRILRAMYNDTQAWLRDHGVKDVVLARGAKFAPGRQPRGVNWNGQVEPRQVKSRPLSSWATNLFTAGTFARPWGDQPGQDVTYSVLSAATVPASRIFSTEFTGIVRRGEAEVVVLGGTDTAFTRAERMTGTETYHWRHEMEPEQLTQEFGNAGS